jgi:hypothetical protein
MLVAPAHELEEHHAPGPTDGQIADFVDHHAAGEAQRAEARGQPAAQLRFLEPADEIGQRRVIHPPAALGRGHG